MRFSIYLSTKFNFVLDGDGLNSGLKLAYRQHQQIYFEGLNKKNTYFESLGTKFRMSVKTTLDCIHDGIILMYLAYTAMLLF